MRLFLGLDMSIRNSSVCTLRVEKGKAKVGLTQVAVPKKVNGTPVTRKFAYFFSVFDKCISDIESKFGHPDIVFLEGPAFGAFGSSKLSLSEFQGIVKMVLQRHKMDFISIAPNSLKLYATGNGRAKKEEMEDKCEEEFGLHFGGNKKVVSDKADSLWLAKFAHDFYTIKNGIDNDIPRHRRLSVKRLLRSKQMRKLEKLGKK